MVSLGYPKLADEPDNAISAELFDSPTLLKHKDFEICTHPSASKLIDKVNSGKWTLEFVTKYKYYDIGWLIECYFHSARKMRRCYLTVDFRQIRFFWNEVLEDRIW